MPIKTALERLDTHTEAEHADDDSTARWFTALINQQCLAPGKGTNPTWYTTITPLFAPAGRMTLTNNWTKAADHCRANPNHLYAALTHWERVDGYAGANLDYHSTGDAHMVSTGTPSQQGVPGATWLALHAFATFRLTGHTPHHHTTAWNHHPHPTLTWPAWHPPLTQTAITTLLEHPHLHTPHPNPTTLTNLGITALYQSTRTRLTNSHGPLQPATQLHP